MAKPFYERIRCERVEQLEDRCTPDAYFVNGVLTIFGTGGADFIQVNQVGESLSVGNQIFPTSTVQQIVIDAGDGNDTISIDPSIRAEVWAFGRGGNDHLTGGGGRNFLYGGSGNDTLVAGTGPDVLDGGSGANSVQGRTGNISARAGLTQSARMGVVGQAIAQLVNQERVSAGLAPLEVNAQLVAAGEIHSRNMASLVKVYGHAGAMNHLLLGSTAPTLGIRADLVGYDYRMLAENLAFGYLTPQAVVQAWMNSPGHRANILNPNLTQVGVGVAWTTDGFPYYTLMLGTPMPVAGPASTPAAAATSVVTNRVPPALSSQSEAEPRVTNPGMMPSASHSSPEAMRRGWIALGADRGSAPWVSIVDAATGKVQRQFLAYDRNFRGGVRVAVADVTGDGVADVVTAPGPGMPSWMKVFDGATGRETRTFLAYHPFWTHGVHVAAGDVTGDGWADIVTSSDAPSAGLVRVFDGRTLGATQTFYAFAGTRGGSRVWVGDLNGDGRGEILAAGAAPNGLGLRVFDARTAHLIQTFQTSGSTIEAGVGDVDGDGRNEMVIADAARGSVQVYTPRGLETSRFSVGATAGLHLVVRDVDGDGVSEMLTITTTNAPARRIQIWSKDGLARASLMVPSAGPRNYL